jgi:hypothetical protein
MPLGLKTRVRRKWLRNSQEVRFWEVGHSAMAIRSRAMTMLLSSRNLPRAGIDPLALLLDRLHHLLRRIGIETPRELA